MSEVDIYIERMNMFRYSEKRKKKRRTGVWGVTALEAACLGKVVVTNFYGREVYEKEYGECALQSANSEEEMETILINLLSKPKSELMELKKKTRLWVEEYHTFEKVGMKLRRIYEEL